MRTRALGKFVISITLGFNTCLVSQNSWCTQTLSQSSSAIVEQGISHPLDPLNRAEIELAVDIIRSAGRLKPGTRFSLIDLYEPSKGVVRADLASGNFHRMAQASMYDWETGEASEAVLDLNESSVISFDPIAVTQPTSDFLTSARIREILVADERWSDAMAQRGIEDFSGIGMSAALEFGESIPIVNGDLVVTVAIWPNYVQGADEAGLHYLQMKANLTRGQIIEFVDQKPANFKQTNNSNETITNHPPLKPLAIEQPSGPSFKIDGSRIQWQNWELHYGINPRRGLEIYDVNYKDGDRKRSVLYRASISEMVTPYGDRGWKTWLPIDEGELPIAPYSLRPAEVGEDSPPNAIYRSAESFSASGEVIHIPRAVSIFERDDGLLWRHFAEARRARALVLTSFYTVDNYDYAISWTFHQDGSIEAEVLLSGKINHYYVERQREASPSLENEAISHVLVAPGVAGPIHQHFFSYRLDLDVDGQENSVLEMNTSRLHPEGEDVSTEWFATEATMLTDESSAKRMVDVAASRWWKIANTNFTTSLGQHPAYALLPGRNTFPYPGQDSPVRKLMGFLDAHLWVTRYESQEMYAAGKYLRHELKGGLPVWTKANRSVKNTDVVVWYTMGITHLPRPEDWPIMPSRRVGFKLAPFGFFTENPTMGVSKPNPWN